MPDTGPHHRPASRAELIAAFAAVYVLWGSTYLAIRFGVETIPPFVLAGCRHLTAGLILYAIVRRRGAPRPKAKHWRSAAMVGGLLLLGGNGLVTWAEQRVPSGLAALIVASVPIWMTVLDAAQRRERPHGVVVLGLALGLGGIAFLVAPGQFAGGTHIDPLGAGALLTAALFWATGSLYSRRAALPSSTFLATAMEMIAGGVLLMAVAAATGEWSAVSPAAVSTKSLLSLGYLIVAGSLLGFTAYVFLLKATTPARVSTYAYVNPVVAVFLGWLFAGEPVTARTLLATAVIVVSVALIIKHGARRSTVPAEENVVPLRAEGGRR
jgi:drug/metabolite transporter (DMT)-like permease